jgi:peptide/nickel transport system substrate-binding protein
MRKGLAAVATLLLAASVVAGCGGSKSSSSGTTGSVKEGGTLRLGTNSRIDSLNPYVAFNQDAYTTFMYIYPFLVQYDQKLNFTPDFATKWESSKDGLTWTFHTRPNAKWSDGKPLTAEDAAWTINTDVKYQGTGAANAAGLVAHVKSASAPDPNTLVVTYERPVGNVLSQFQQLAILPKHVWAGQTGHKGADLKTFPNSAPIVSGGTFILTKFKKDEIALFERNPTFYGPKPHIKGFGLRMFSNDDALVSAMKSGELDALETVPPTAIETLKQAGVVVSKVAGVTTNDFIFNANTKKPKHRELRT